MSGDYERFQENKKFFFWIGVVLVVLGLASMIGASMIGAWIFSATQALSNSGFTLFVLGLYVIALADFQRRMARMQAALDMKRMTLQAGAQTGNQRIPQHLAPGDTLQLRGVASWVISADRAVMLHIEEVAP
jgi:hypothetical protein